MLGASQASALPPVPVDPAPGVLLAQAAKPGAPPGSAQQAPEDRPASLADLNEVLAATRAKLEELFKATATLAERREEFEALKQENERLAAELQEAGSRQAELERSSEAAEARIAELTDAVDVAVREAAGIDKELAGVLRQNTELEESVARAETARAAAQAELEKTRTAMQAQLEAATAAAEQSRTELAGLREQLERTGQELATAKSARAQTADRATEMEKAVERAGAEAERLKSELAAAKEQLGQAATAAIEAERARQVASSEADQLRGEAKRAGDELAAVRSEIDRLKTANTELEEQVGSLHADSKSAMQTARRNLIVMEEKIEELNTALAGAGLAATTPARGPQAAPESGADGRAAGSRSESETAQRSAPDPADEITAGERADSAAALAMVRPSTAPSQADDSGLSRFDANVRYLNSRALAAAGANLFSGIEAAGDGVVHVSTTPAWNTIPPAGQRSYLNSLLDLWIVAQDGSGPAIVRIVDASGRVLLEKSGAAEGGPRDQN